MTLHWAYIAQSDSVSFQEKSALSCISSVPAFQCGDLHNVSVCLSQHVVRVCATRNAVVSGLLFVHTVVMWCFLLATEGHNNCKFPLESLRKCNCEKQPKFYLVNSPYIAPLSVSLQECSYYPFLGHYIVTSWGRQKHVTWRISLTLSEFFTVNSALD